MFDGDGLPINDAMIEIWQADAQGRYANPRDNRALPNASSRASAARRPTRTASSASIPSSPARCRARTARCRRRILCSASFRAACCGRSIPGSISPTRPPTPVIPSSTWSHRPARDACRPQGGQGRNADLPLRHPGAGRQRDGFLRHLSQQAFVERRDALPTVPTAWPRQSAQLPLLRCHRCRSQKESALFLRICRLFCVCAHSSCPHFPITFCG